MTTIAFRDGILASDSLVTGSNIKEGMISKIQKIRVTEQLSFIDRVVFRKEPQEITYLVGYAGAVYDALDYIDCIFFGAEQEKSYDCTVIAARETEDGYEVAYYGGETMRGIPLKNPFSSIGSGSEIALGAMYQGATAHEAVNAAIQFDSMSGGSVQTLSFEDDE